MFFLASFGENRLSHNRAKAMQSRFSIATKKVNLSALENFLGKKNILKINRLIGDDGDEKLSGSTVPPHFFSEEPREQEVEKVVFLNARHVHDLAMLKDSLTILESGDKAVWQEEEIIGFSISPSMARRKEKGEVSKQKTIPTVFDDKLMFNKSIHRCIIDLEKSISEMNELAIASGKYKEWQKGVWIEDDSIEIHPSVIFETMDNKTVIIDKRACLSAHSVVQGPAYLGENSRLKVGTHLVSSAVGKESKVGGEVLVSVIGNYTNKAHSGFLGHSMIGDFVNIGAGTVFSNLKNTYGLVLMDYIDEKISTGSQFMGALVGDYCKFPINASIYGGKVIGSGSFLGDKVFDSVNGFQFFSQKGQEQIRIESLIESQKRVLARRDIEWSDWDSQLFLEAYEAAIAKS